MKKRLITIVTVVALILILPITAVLTGFCLPAQFNETYYGEYKYMFERLKNTQGKKIVLVGNSALAFGVRTDLLDEEFPDYTVVNFGLYGALGTKFMLDTSKVNVSSGDVVIIMPELVEQSTSLYFSASDAWRAADGDYSVLGYIAESDRSYMVGAFAGYVGEKFNAATGRKKPATDGVYAANSFKDEEGNEVGYMTYSRPYNVMSGGYDPTNAVRFGAAAVDARFIKYLNEYAAYAKKKGAGVYFGFTPVNTLAVGEESVESVSDETYAFLSANLDFPIVGHPEKYFLDYEWFYDNNFHMNSAGALVYTDLLAEDIKFALGVDTPNKIELPDKPEIPVNVVYGENADADCFTYEKREGATGGYIFITGLTEVGKTRTSLTIPTDYDGVPVTGFAADVFAGNTTISIITLTENVGTIYDNSFYGATRLKRLYFRHDSVLGINMGEDFLSGADDCDIYLKNGVSAVDCAGGWARYEGRIKHYEAE